MPTEEGTEARISLALAHEPLDYQAQLQRAITENTASGLVLVGADGHTTYMNPAAVRLLGYTTEELAAVRLHDAVHHSHPDGTPYPPEECPHFAAFFRGEPSLNVSEWLVRKDGTFFPASVSMTPLFKGGVPVGAVYEFRDATEQHRASEASREADRRKDQFLAILGHELRNPIATIQNAMEVVSRRAADEATASMHAIVLRQAEHLHRLVDELLDVARIQTGKISLDRRTIDLRDVARSVIDAAGTAGRLDAHEVSLSVPGEPLWVDGDRARLEQLLGNFLDNALKFTPPSKSIRLMVERQDGCAVMSVTDEGQGIDAASLPRLFRLFAQADQPLDRPYGGLGVGLALARAIAELHGGDVSALSTGPGQGSTFSARVPIAATAPPPKALADARSRVSRRVVVVEDNTDAREALVALLEEESYQVRGCATGREAIAILPEVRPHIAFVDVGLPEMDGYAVARAIRANGGGGIRLVALTGYGQAQDIERALAAGFDSHITKPASLDQLVSEIAAVGKNT